MNKRLADRELKLRLTDAAKVFITDHGYDPVYGARPLKRYLQKNVETLAARIILADGVGEGSVIVIDVDSTGRSPDCQGRNNGFFILIDDPGLLQTEMLAADCFCFNTHYFTYNISIIK